jgi:YggT family protein
MPRPLVAAGAALYMGRATGSRRPARLSREAPPQGSSMQPLVKVLIFAIDIYWWIVILAVVFSWLYAFNIVNSRNQLVDTISNFLYRATEPLFARIRRFLPNLGGIDIAPILVILGLYLIREYLVYLFRFVP